MTDSHKLPLFSPLCMESISINSARALGVRAACAPDACPAGGGRVNGSRGPSFRPDLFGRLPLLLPMRAGLRVAVDREARCVRQKPRGERCRQEAQVGFRDKDMIGERITRLDPDRVERAVLGQMDFRPRYHRHAATSKRSPWGRSISGAKQAAIQMVTDTPCAPSRRSPLLTILPSSFRSVRRGPTREAS